MAVAEAPGNPGINNTAYLFFVIALAFIFYVTIKGDLGKWLGLLGLGPSAASPQPSQAMTGTPSLGGGLPGLPGLGSQQTSVSPLPNTNVPISDLFGNPVGYGNPNYAGGLSASNIDTSNFSGQGALYNYAPSGPSFIDTGTF